MKENPSLPDFRGFKWWLAAIGILAVAVRFGFLSFLHHQYMQSGVTAWHGVHALCIAQGHPFEVDSSLAYQLQALQNKENRLVDPQEILDGGYEIKPDMKWHGSDVPGYSFLLAGLWKFLPARYIFAQVLVMTLDVLASLAIAIAVCLLFDRAGGVAAGALYALFPLTALLSLFASRDHFGALGIVFSFLFLFLYLKTMRTIYLLLSSFVLALFSWFRPFGVVLPIFYGAGIMIYLGARKGIRDTLLMFGVLVLAFFLPYSLLNKALYNRFFPSFPYIPLAQSLGEIPNSHGFQNSDEYCVQEARRATGREDLSLTEVGDYWRERVITVVRTDPSFVGRVLIHRAKTTPTMGYTPFLNMPREGLGGWWNLIAIPLRWFLKTILLWMAIGLALVWWKRGWRLALVALAPGVGYFLSIFLFRWPDPRYYYPWLVTPIIVFGATIGILAEKTLPLICRRK